MWENKIVLALILAIAIKTALLIIYITKSKLVINIQLKIFSSEIKFDYWGIT